jgi:hypothetical protein
MVLAAMTSALECYSRIPDKMLKELEVEDNKYLREVIEANIKPANSFIHLW